MIFPRESWIVLAIPVFVVNSLTSIVTSSWVIPPTNLEFLYSLTVKNLYP